MKYLLVLGALYLLVSCQNMDQSETGASYSGHPIIGSWTMTKNSCEEKYTFTDDGFRRVKSNEELVKAKYEISDISPEKGIFLLKDTVLEDNGRPDCSGSTSVMVGDVVEVLLFIQSDPERFSFCFDPNLESCYGPFLKSE
ncbi:hypothetical protein [Shewanella sp. Koi 1]